VTYVGISQGQFALALLDAQQAGAQVLHHALAHEALVNTVE